MLQVNMGEECMGHFINYVKKRSSLPLSFFVMSGKQYRWAMSIFLADEHIFASFHSVSRYIINFVEG